MIPRIHQVDQLKEDLWLVYFTDPNEPRFPIIRIVPVDENPVSCPGGEIWCKQFGCIPGDNIFTRSETEILLEEGQKLPECELCGLNPFECEHTEWKRRELT